MGRIFANRIIAGTWKYSDVPAAYRAATDEALREKVEKGVITEERLAELIDV